MDNTTNSHSGTSIQQAASLGKLRFHRFSLSLNTGAILARLDSKGQITAFLGAALRLREGDRDKVFVVQPSDLRDHKMISPEPTVITLEGETRKRLFDLDFQDCPEVSSVFEGMTPGGGYCVIYTGRIGHRPEFTYTERAVVSSSWDLPSMVREGAKVVGRLARYGLPLVDDDTMRAIDLAMGMSTAWYLAAQCLRVTGGDPKMPQGPQAPAELMASADFEVSRQSSQRRGSRQQQQATPSAEDMTNFIRSLDSASREALLSMKASV